MGGPGLVNKLSSPLTPSVFRSLDLVRLWCRNKRTEGPSMEEGAGRRSSSLVRRTRCRSVHDLEGPGHDC